MSEYKTNYFGSFLDSFNRHATRGAAVTPPQSSAPAGAGGVLDALTQALHAHGGAADVKSLLPVTQFSIDLLIDALDKLKLLGVVRVDDGKVSLTDSGRAVAAEQQKIPPAA